MFLIVERNHYHENMYKQAIHLVFFAPYALKNKLILYPSSILYFFHLDS